MEFESTDNIAMVYETLKNINIAITRLQERSTDIHSVNDYLMSPTGMEKLDRKYGRFFSRMIQLRMKADYNSVAEVTEAEVLEMEPLSTNFITSVEALLPTET